MTYLYGDIQFQSVIDGVIKLSVVDKFYMYEVESNEMYYNIVYRNSYPTQYSGVRKVKKSLLNELKKYEIK